MIKSSQNNENTLQVYEVMANGDNFVELKKDDEIYSVPPISYGDVSYHNSYELSSENKDLINIGRKNIPTIEIHQCEPQDILASEMHDDEAIVYADIRDEQEISHLYSIVRKNKN